MWRLLLLSLVLHSCNSYKEIDPALFNNEIANRTDIKTPEQLVTLLSYPSAEGNPNRTFETKDCGNGNYKVVMIEYIIGDDSVCGQRIEMWATKNGETWQVTKIKRARKCCKDTDLFESWRADACP